jgi:hypothetical protein
MSRAVKRSFAERIRIREGLFNTAALLSGTGLVLWAHAALTSGATSGSCQTLPPRRLSWAVLRLVLVRMRVVPRRWSGYNALPGGGVFDKRVPKAKVSVST